MLKLVSSRKVAAPVKKTAAKKAASSKRAARPRYDDDDDDEEYQARTPSKVAARGSRGASRGEPQRRAGQRTGVSGVDRRRDAERGKAEGGWDESDKVFAGGDFATNLRLKDGEEKVIRFLEDAPYASMRIHWLRGRKGKQSFPCPGDPRKELKRNGCPLCAYGFEYKSEARFNVAVLTEDEPQVMSLAAGARMRKNLRGHHDSKHGPLTRKYYFFRRIGKELDTEYSFDVVRQPEHIAEDYEELYIPTEEELDELVLFTEEHANKEFSPMAELRKVAQEMVGDDIDDDE